MAHEGARLGNNRNVEMPRSVELNKFAAGAGAPLHAHDER